MLVTTYLLSIATLLNDPKLAVRLVADESNVETAVFEVGYESPSHFSREYSRMFGDPPKRDIASIRELVI